MNYGNWINDPHLGTFLWPPTSVYALRLHIRKSYSREQVKISETVYSTSEFWNCLAWKGQANGFLFTPAIMLSRKASSSGEVIPAKDRFHTVETIFCWNPQSFPQLQILNRKEPYTITPWCSSCLAVPQPTSMPATWAAIQYNPMEEYFKRASSCAFCRENVGEWCSQAVCLHLQWSFKHIYRFLGDCLMAPNSPCRHTMI